MTHRNVPIFLDDPSLGVSYHGLVVDSTRSKTHSYFRNRGRNASNCDCFRTIVGPNPEEVSFTGKMNLKGQTTNVGIGLVRGIVHFVVS